MPIEHVSIDWVWIRNQLNRIIDEVNKNKPLGSSSIAVQETTTGTLLTLTRGSEAGGGDDPWRITPDGQTADWNTAAIKISDGAGGCVDAWIWYWGTPASTTPRP